MNADWYSDLRKNTLSFLRLNFLVLGALERAGLDSPKVMRRENFLRRA
jgi:hypothetical protein